MIGEGRSTAASVAVVGAGISGLACACALMGAGVSVRVLDRGRRPGGRMASRTIDGRTVDIGAAYAVAPDEGGFADVMAEWVRRGLARPWTATFAVADADGIRDRTTGPMRYAAPGGLRGLVADLARGLDVTTECTVESAGDGLIDAETADEVVLAMPDPQALRLLSADHALREQLAQVQWQPVITAVLSWSARGWPGDLHAVFVNGSADISLIADDGDRRGDGAPVLVVHSAPELASAHLDDPDGAIPAMREAVQRIVGIAESPVGALAHRWRFARPQASRAEPFARADGVSVCGDAWGGPPSVRTAWASGDALGRAIAADFR